MKRASLKTIALEVGVATSTVSRVLNNDATCYVSSAKRDAILESIKRHKYTPNINARNLLQGKTSNIAFVTRKFDHLQKFGPFWLATLDGIQEELQNFGYSGSLATISSAEDIERLASKMSLYDGIIFGRGVVTNDGFNILNEGGKPAVFLDEPDIGQDFPCVRVNKEVGIIELAVHLQTLGCKRVAIYGVADYASVIMEIFNQHGLILQPHDLYGFTKQNVYNLMLEAYENSDVILEKLSSYDAICCTNDFVAHGLCHRLKKQGIKVGKDIAVTGFDNIDELLDVPLEQRFLTTVDNPRKIMGRECARLLIDKINGSSNVILKEIDSTLVVRDSTANFK
ncbi:MAG: LacI family DNA-binding transcriptional regulator [Victivallaceae bacterium]